MSRTIVNRAELAKGGNLNGKRPELYREGIIRAMCRHMNRVAEGIAAALELILTSLRS